MSVVAIIPSRYGSSRFPGKPLALICGKPMIQHVYQNTVLAEGLDGTYVATDDQRIYDCVTGFGGQALMTSPDCPCGTDRVIECVDKLKLKETDIVLNIQGDEPLIRHEMIEELIRIFDDESCYMGTLKQEIYKDTDIQNPNIVKVISDSDDNAIYFSRCPIPYNRDNAETKYYKHIGVYGYKVGFIKKFGAMSRSSLEISESLEQLRAIENGFKIRIKETGYTTVGVDTEEQLQMVEERIKSMGMDRAGA